MSGWRRHGGWCESTGVGWSRLRWRATDREVSVVAAVVAAGSEKAAVHRLGLSHSTVKHHLANARSKVGAATMAQLVWILAPRLPEPEGMAQADERWPARRGCGATGPAQRGPTHRGESRSGEGHREVRMAGEEPSA